MSAHTHCACASVQETCLGSEFKTLHYHVYDRAWPHLDTDRIGALPELKSHSGARPLAASSSSGTRNMLSARFP
jgi:hypothetical protein